MAGGHKKRILIIDDDAAALLSLKELLALSGYEAEAIQEAKEVIQRIKAVKPDLILLDLLMPHLGGFEICELLNSDKDTQGIPIIVVSALSKESDIKKAYHLGVIGYVTKPYDFTKLLHEIAKALASKEENIG